MGTAAVGPGNTGTSIPSSSAKPSRLDKETSKSSNETGTGRVASPNPYMFRTTFNGAGPTGNQIAKATDSSSSTKSKASDKVDAKDSDDGESSDGGGNGQSGTCSGCCGANCNPAWTGNSEAVEPAALEKTTTSEAPAVELASIDEPEQKDVEVS